MRREKGKIFSLQVKKFLYLEYKIIKIDLFSHYKMNVKDLTKRLNQQSIIKKIH